jgi:urea transporter
MTARQDHGYIGVYNASPFTLNDTEGSMLATTVNGVLKVATSADVSGGYSYNHIAAGAAATFVIKASAGTLHTITLNSAATATNVTTIYDNPSGSGTVIAVPAVTTATVPTTLTFDIAFALGLTIITTTANGGDMTICYK